MKNNRLNRYENEFNYSVNKCYRWWNIFKPRIKYDQKDIDAEKLSTAIEEHLHKNSLPSLEVSAMQCLKWTVFLQAEFLKRYFMKTYNLKAWLTIGELWDGDTAVFCPSESQLNEWVSNGVHPGNIPKTGINVHAWLTTENGYVIDLTLLSSKSVFLGGKWKSYAGKVLVLNLKDESQSLKYKPLLVGSNIAWAIHEKSSIPLLAENTNELHIEVVTCITL